jgi:hypothetical protein
LSVDRSDCCGTLEPIGQDFNIDHFDATGLNEADYAGAKYLMPPKAPGPVLSAVRGKQIVIVAGYVRESLSLARCMLIYGHTPLYDDPFGLEASLIRMKCSDDDEFVSTSAPGSNKRKSNANKLRCFCLLKHFINPASAKTAARHATILAALDIVYVWQDNLLAMETYSQRKPTPNRNLLPT